MCFMYIKGCCQIVMLIVLYLLFRIEMSEYGLLILFPPIPAGLFRSQFILISFLLVSPIPSCSHSHTASSISSDCKWPVNSTTHGTVGNKKNQPKLKCLTDIKSRVIVSDIYDIPFPTVCANRLLSSLCPKTGKCGVFHTKLPANHFSSHRN